MLIWGTNSSAAGGEGDAGQHVSTNYVRTGCTTALPTAHQLKEKHTDKINILINTHTCTNLCNTHAMSWRDPWRIGRNTGPCIFGHNLSPTSPSCSRLGFEDKGQPVWMVGPPPQSIHSCVFSSSDIPFPVCARVAGTRACFTLTITGIDKDNKCTYHDMKQNGLMKPHLTDLWSTLGLHDILHAIVMCISSVKTVLWLAIQISITSFQMEWHLIHRAVDHWQAMQYHVHYGRWIAFDNECDFV